MQNEMQELKEKAKKYGLKFVGVKKEDLIKQIAEVESKKAVSEENSSEEKPEVENKEPINAAIIYSGKNELRRYTKEDHGKNFAKLAEQFVEKNPEYTVEYVNVAPAVICPHCGGKILGK